MKIALINSYTPSPFDDLFKMSAMQKMFGLVNKLFPNIKSNLNGTAMIPLALPILASLTPPSYEISVYDEQVEILPDEIDADIIAMSFISHTAPHAYQLADKFRKQGKKVVLGGSHVSLMPDEATEHADSICIGEAEGQWENILNDISQGKEKKIYKSDKKPVINDMPIPDFSVLKRKPYFPMHPIQISRGCPHICEFCAVPALFGNQPRMRNLNSVIKEIQDTKDRYLAFVDDNIAVKPDYLKQLLNVLKHENKKWFCQANLNIAKDVSLLKEMYNAGCRLILVGLESVTPENLDNFASRKNKFDEMKRMVNIIIDEKIAVMGMFILGFDYDSEETISELSKFLEETNITFPSITMLTPFPGTKAFERFKTEGRLLNYDWKNYNFYTGIIEPKRISLPDLKKEIAFLWKKNYTLKSVFKRAMFFKDMVAFFILFGLGFRMSYYKLARNYLKG